MSPNAKGALLALLAFGVYASHDVVVKVLGEVYSPFQIVFFSVLFAFPLATVMLMRDANPGTLVPVHPWWMALRTIAAVTTGITVFYAFTVLPLAQTYAILFATPLLITLLAIPILGEKVGLHRGLAVLVGLIGVVVVLRPGETALSLGHLAALTAAVASSFASIVVRRVGAAERPVVMMLYPMVANFAVMGVILPFVYIPMPIEHLGLIALMSALGWTAGRLIISAYRSGEAVVVAPMQYSQIIWATGFGYWFFSESVDVWTITGAGIIILSGVYIVLREGLGGNSENTPVLRTRSRPETGTMFRIGALQRLLDRRKPDR